MNLEDQFHSEMVRIYREAADFGYYANYFLRMVSEYGGLTAAKRLLNSDPSDGFVRLWEEGRLDLSVEALAIQEPWNALFTDAELNEATKRLEDLGFDFTSPA